MGGCAGHGGAPAPHLAPPEGSTAPAELSGFRGRTPELRSLTLRFVDPELERAFQQSYLRDNLPYIRMAHVLGAVTWAVFALLAQLVVTEGDEWDLLLRFGVAIPLTLVSLALTYTRWFQRHWQEQLAIVLLLSAVVWSTQRAVVEDARPDWGYAGLMLILAFNYVLTRIQFVPSAVVGALMIAYHNVIAIAFTDEIALDIVFAWPTGEPMEVRIGIATGPVVAGVIGRRKFAYDLWGDTVNVASRLQTNARPGGILVSEPTALLVEGHFALGEPCVVQLKGKGPTHARYLLGRVAEPSAASETD